MNRIAGDDESLILEDEGSEYTNGCGAEFRIYKQEGVDKIWLQINQRLCMQTIDDLIALRDFLTRKIDALSQPKDA